ncbi:hypothetical protein GCM10025867_38710 [Frondihabitans sucicola]|uniref:Uncharacterized protein n=1 Tax=Frondihabitans sucicola TaxID=1268041 RepID=A0ABM8GT74_9MICO|nr:hypothetical protein GCM10025867_38710 [Frondihabitans sucicola]
MRSTSEPAYRTVTSPLPRVSVLVGFGDELEALSPPSDEQAEASRATLAQAATRAAMRRGSE